MHSTDPFTTTNRATFARPAPADRVRPFKPDATASEVQITGGNAQGPAAVSAQRQDFARPLGAERARPCKPNLQASSLSAAFGQPLEANRKTVIDSSLRQQYEETRREALVRRGPPAGERDWGIGSRFDGATEYSKTFLNGERQSAMAQATNRTTTYKEQIVNPITGAPRTLPCQGFEHPSAAMPRVTINSQARAAQRVRPKPTM